MGYIYRYVDRIDDTVKYVGIVHANRSLSKRIIEHLKDDWNHDGIWRVEYQEFPDMSRTDLEYLESHLIAYYRTYIWYNSAKKDWGESAFAKIDEDKWIDFEYHTFIEKEDLIKKLQELDAKNKELSKNVSELKKEKQAWMDSNTTGELDFLVKQLTPETLEIFHKIEKLKEEVRACSFGVEKEKLEQELSYYLGLYAGIVKFNDYVNNIRKDDNHR